MSARSTEKVAAVFRRWFRHQGERDADGGHAGGAGNGAGPSGSPGRRGGLLRVTRHRDGVRPAESAPTVPGSPAGSAGAASAGAGRAAGPNVPRDRAIRARRLMKEYKEIQRMQRPDPLFTVGLVNDNLFEWHVRLHKVDPESELAADMREFCVSDVLLQISFPENFPFAPPFMRVIEPRIEKGFVMEGGAICMELLTPRGWASAYTVEAVVMQFAASLAKGRARIARKHKSGKEFSRRSAEESFRTLVKTHDKYGWVTPDLSDG